MTEFTTNNDGTYTVGEKVGNDTIVKIEKLNMNGTILTAVTYDNGESDIIEVQD